MKGRFGVCVLAFVLGGCAMTSQNNTRSRNIDVGNKFVDAFYSFNRDTLQALLAAAEKSQPEILYYQKWAECAHYQVVDRSQYSVKNDSMVVFPVTVKDDLMSALAIDFNVTDTFHMVLRDGAIRSVKTSSNDPKEYYEAKEWVRKNRPELVEVACEGIWQGGLTPCECVLGMIQGFTELTEKKKQKAQ